MSPKDVADGGGDGAAPWPRIEASTLIFRGVERDSRSFLILGPASSTFGSTLTFDSLLAFAWAIVSSFDRVGPLCGICSRFDVDRALLPVFLDGPCSSRRSAFVPGL